MCTLTPGVGARGRDSREVPGEPRENRRRGTGGTVIEVGPDRALHEEEKRPLGPSLFLFAPLVASNPSPSRRTPSPPRSSPLPSVDERRSRTPPPRSAPPFPRSISGGRALRADRHEGMRATRDERDKLSRKRRKLARRESPERGRSPRGRPLPRGGGRGPLPLAPERGGGRGARRERARVEAKASEAKRRGRRSTRRARGGTEGGVSKLPDRGSDLLNVRPARCSKNARGGRPYNSNETSEGQPVAPFSRPSSPGREIIPFGRWSEGSVRPPLLPEPSLAPRPSRSVRGGDPCDRSGCLLL